MADALSAVLKSVRLEGAVYLDAEFSAPWCIEAKYGLASIRQRLAGAERVLFFHFVVEGGFDARPGPGEPALALREGDLALFPTDHGQVMGSDIRMAPVPTHYLMAGDPDTTPDVFRLRHGGGGTVTRLVCGYLAYNRSVARPLFDALPRVARIPVGDGPTASLLRQLLRVGVEESSSSSPGSQSMLAKLSELLFVEALRRYVEGLPPDGRGWLAGVRDRAVGRALGLMPEAPERPWTVEALAREVAMSRSSFADRFASLIGEPPIQYLARWRLALAAQALRAGRESIVRVAQASGYESEASFSRAFRREFGMPPGAWRRGAPDSLEG